MRWPSAPRIVRLTEQPPRFEPEEEEDGQIWACTIGACDPARLSKWADGPMREKVREAYYYCTGAWPTFIFSGWSAKLTPGQRGVLAAEKEARREPAP